MQDVVLSLNRNLLKITTIQNDSLNSLSADLSGDVVNDSKIINPQAVAEVINDLFGQMHLNPKKASLNFSIEPNQLVLKFVTIGKNTADIEAEIRSKVTDLQLENHYYSYDKIAPYVYQFCAVEKETLENLIKVSDIVAVPIKSILGWPAALPKYAQTNDPAIFIFGSNGSQVIVLSELGGVFFTGEYTTETSTADIDEIVKNLAVYKRSKPITNIYALNFDAAHANPGFTFHKIDFGTDENTTLKGYETNLLVHYILDRKPELLSTSINLVNLLPVPTAPQYNQALVKYSKVGALALVPVLLISLGFFAVTTLSKRSPSANADSPVLSSADTAVETTQSTTSAPVEDKKKPELKKSELIVRVENGSGINGMAAKTKTLLEGLGYVVLEIDTAQENASGTQITFKPSKANFARLLLEDMKESYGELQIKQTLDETTKYDALITIGSNVAL